MGSQETTESIFSEKAALIDFLYIDKEKVDSFLSQIKKGTLRSVKRTNDITQGFSISGEGNVPLVLKGTLSNTNQDKNGLEEQYDPYHSQLLELLNALSLPILTSIPHECTAKLVLLESNISIRNLDSINKSLPVFKNNKSALGLDPKSFKSMDSTLKLLGDLLGLMPLSIDIELEFEFAERINGPIKESGLSIKSEDLLRSYGTKLPGKWITLGIIDEREKLSDNRNFDSIHSVIDQISSSMAELYTRSSLLISPILVFRTVSL